MPLVPYNDSGFHDLDIEKKVRLKSEWADENHNSVAFMLYVGDEVAKKAGVDGKNRCFKFYYDPKTFRSFMIDIRQSGLKLTKPSKGIRNCWVANFQLRLRTFKVITGMERIETKYRIQKGKIYFDLPKDVI